MKIYCCLFKLNIVNSFIEIKFGYVSDIYGVKITKTAIINYCTLFLIHLQTIYNNRNLGV